MLVKLINSYGFGLMIDSTLTSVRHVTIPGRTVRCLGVITEDLFKDNSSIRYLKPKKQKKKNENLLLDENGNLKVSNFG